MKDCKETVWGANAFVSHQCMNAAKKDGYCLIHHPDKVKERLIKNEIRRDATWAKRPTAVMGRKIARLQSDRDKLLVALKQTVRFLDGHVSQNVLLALNKLIAEVDK